jgi:phosphoribosyl-AMP cyclohydrolase
MADDNDGWLDKINWDQSGLVPAVAQDYKTGKILTLAWMNRESLKMTAQTGKAVYWSRARNTLWVKGETSGHVQWVKQIRSDCDQDVIQLSVEQAGGIACHTGRYSCFYYLLEGDQWKITEAVIKDPKIIYKSDS